MATERDLEKRCRLYAESLGGRLIKIRTPGSKGFHDRLLLLPRFVAFLEFKHPGGTGRTSDMQKRWQQYLMGLEIPAWQVASFNRFRTICEERTW